MTNTDSDAPIRSWASERLAAAIRQSLDRLARSDDVCHVAVQFRIDFPSSSAGIVSPGRSIICPRRFRQGVSPDSSAGWTTGFLNRGSEVRVLPGAFGAANAGRLQRFREPRLRLGCLNRGSEVRILPGALQKPGSPGTWARSPRSSGAPVVPEL